MRPAAHTVVNELDEMRERWWLYTLLFNLSVAGALSIFLSLSFVTAEWRWGLSAAVRIGLFLLWCGMSLGLLAATLIYSLARQRSLAATARRLELAFPELESDLINLVQIAEQPTDDPFDAAAAEEAARRVADVPLDSAPYCYNIWSRWRLGLHTSGDLLGVFGVILLLMAVGLLTWFFTPRWTNSLNRLLPPWRADATSSASSFVSARSVPLR